eukprot:TRINITY_DN7508_c0_g1_i1.p1 TRINITY_DN7508_c0_g1~~TRINITY_DN7508_c0_g1_i1.p1  ORF type:complete len:420 (+),score=112.06 TRINITY_DN7508_c0_g1_i1:172-1260(+)
MAFAKAHDHGDTEPHKFQEAHSTLPENVNTTEPINQHQTTQDINKPHDIPPVQQHQPMAAVPPQQPMVGGVPALPPKHDVPAPAPVPSQQQQQPIAAVPPQQPLAAGVPAVPPHLPMAGSVPPPPPATVPPPANIHQHAQGSVEGNDVSMLGALKDKTVGSIKETFGSATGNQNMEIQGKAQNIHGHHQNEFAKAEKEGLKEPAHFAHGTNANEQPMAQGTVEGQHQPSTLSAIKDQVMGSVKETFGSATGNMNTEIAGKAQKIHGHNESEFVKAQSSGLSEPAHFEHGTKTTDPVQAHGEVVGEGEPSKTSGYKDQAVGAMKEKMGSTTGNQNMEIAGKAQKMQGSIQCNLADEKKNTMNA